MTANLRAGDDSRTASAAPILLSDSGLLAHGRLRATLSGTDCAVVRKLLDRHPNAVPTRELVEILWPGTSPTDLARRTRLVRVRRQLATVDLALRCRPGVGYTLERSAIAAHPAS